MFKVYYVFKVGTPGEYVQIGQRCLGNLKHAASQIMLLRTYFQL